MLPPRQYYVTSTRSETVPDGYRAESVGDWHLVFDESFDAVPVVAGDDRVGLVVGTVLDVRERCTDGELRLDDAADGDTVDTGTDGRDADPDAGVADTDTRNSDAADPLDAAFRDALFDFAGHYLGFVEADGPYAYTDPIGGCPVVFDPGEGVAGATPAALPGVDHRERFRADLFDRLNPDDGNIFVPGETTYYAGIRRLLPNHRLDLRTGETSRHWPAGPEDVSTTETATDVAAFVGDALRDVFDEIVATYDRPVNALTAGQDSRTLLAAARPWLLDREIGTVTWDTGGSYDIDLDVARRLSAGYDFDWTPVPVVKATEAQKRRWLEETGHAVGGTIMEIHPTLATFDADLHVNGFGGAMARSKYWTESDDADATFDASELLYRFYLPDDPVLRDSVADWQRTVSEFDAFTRLDLMFQELRLGCWAGPHFPGIARHRDVVSPLSYAPIVRKMYRLSPAVRRAGSLQYIVVDRLWSELNEYPYNVYGDWRDLVRKARDLRKRTRFALTRPGVGFSFLARKLTGR